MPLSSSLAAKVKAGGAHWVTVKEGPLRGRHILIDGPRPEAGTQSKGRILAGKGIPVHVIEKLGATHASDVEHDHIGHDEHGEPAPGNNVPNVKFVTHKDASGNPYYKTPDGKYLVMKDHSNGTWSVMKDTGHRGMQPGNISDGYTSVWDGHKNLKDAKGHVAEIIRDDKPASHDDDVYHQPHQAGFSHMLGRDNETGTGTQTSFIDGATEPEKKETPEERRQRQKREKELDQQHDEFWNSGGKSGKDQSEQDIRTEEQANRDIAYDVGEKVGGARKDTFVGNFTQSPTARNLEELEKFSPEIAQKTCVKKNIMTPTVDAIQRDHDNGVDIKASMLKHLVYDRIAAKPSGDTPEDRRQYLTAIKELQRILEPVRSWDEMKNSIRDLMTQARAMSTKRRQDYRDAIDWRDRLAAQDNQSDWDLKHINEKPEYIQRLNDAEQNYLKFPFEALGDKLTNFLTNSESAHRTFKTLAAKGDLTWEQFGGKTGGTPKDKPKLRGDEKKKWERKAEAEHLRTGGRKTDVERPEDMLSHFGVRGVEFGHWVDDASGKYHLKRSAEALQDLADILGIDDKHTSLNGRLALAFGARGSGNALAHYEPAKKVINMTKYGGAGSLAHEWGHAMDNILYQYSHGGRPSINLGSEGGMGDEDPELKKHYDALINAIRNPTPGSGMTGTRTVAIDTENAPSGGYYRDMRREVQAGASFEDTVNKWTKTINDQQDRALQRVLSPESYARIYKDPKKAEEAREKDIKKIERARKRLLNEIPQMAAYEVYKKTGQHMKGYHDIPTGESEYLSRMKQTDGKGKDYWSSNAEMFARVFESYIQHKLDEQNRYNNYLVHGTREKDVEMSEAPFPKGAERENMFHHMEKLLNHIVKGRALEKALTMLSQGGRLLVKRQTTRQESPQFIASGGRLLIKHARG